MSHTMLCTARLDVLRQAVASVAHLPGALAELGVCRGGSALVLHQSAPHRRLHLFDTFAGLPEPDPTIDQHIAGRFAASVVEAVTPLQSAPVTVHVGRFPDSIEGMILPPLAMVHVDGDLYWTTRHALEVFWPVLVPGGVMVFDDYATEDCPGVRRALHEAGYPLVAPGTGQAVMRKAA